MAKTRQHRRNQKNGKTILILFLIVLVMVVVAGAFLFFRSRSTQTKPEDVLKKYMSYIEKQQYEKMYALVNPDSVSKEDFINRNQNIYEGIGCSNMKIKIKDSSDKSKDSVSYTASFDTLAGKVSFDNKASFKKDKEKGWLIQWKDSLIFPDLLASDKVRIYSDEAQRGQIVDRNNQVLAGSGPAYSVGLVPGKMNADSSADIQKLAQLLGMEAESIQSSLDQSWVTEDSFVPLSRISVSDTSLQDQLLTIAGVKLSTVQVRTYPLGASASQLIGYVGTVTAEDLEKHKGEGYTSESVIGKSGLESLYEKELRGKTGYTLVIEDENGEQKSILAYTEKKDGETIKLTIDSALQSQIYSEFQNDEGASVAMNPYTGEVLALVSTPSYNNNDFILGLSQGEWDTLNNSESNPMYNRFRQAWAPGSTLKPFTAAIGLSEGVLDPQKEYEDHGKSWQKDNSWGDYYVTTLEDYSPVTLENALVYSDNIFFAKTALNIGADKFMSGLDKLGFNVDVPFEIKLTKSQYANDGKITKEIQLADSGYGQGQVLVNPIHLASMYTAFSNNGNMIQPYLIYKDTPSAKVWIETAISPEHTSILVDDLKAVVNRPEGSGYASHRTDMELAGKTGTAELKSEQGTQGEEIGWFSVFTTDPNLSKPILLVSMVDGVHDKGGSTYVVKKDAAILNSYLK